MKDIQHGGTVPATAFRWKDRNGQFHNPQDMETRHLFMSLIMIWNSTVPTEAIIRSSGHWNHHLYELGSFYTRDYLIQAIRALSEELGQRKNMEEAWAETLCKIMQYLSTHQLTN